jgi:hypothetical protein
VSAALNFSRSLDSVRRLVRRALRPIERLTPSQWCEKYLQLPPGKENRAGPVRFHERPFLREIIDCADEPGVTDVVLVGPTRLGKTFVLRMLFAFSIACDPAPAMWVDTTVDTARRVSRKELRPLVEYNPVLRERKPGNRHHFADLAMLFPGAAFGMVGANSDNQVAGDTVTRILGNEVGKWRGATDKDANIQEQVRHRTEDADEDRFHCWSCTPDLEQGLVWNLAQRGDMRKWQAICPRCDRAQEMVWGDRASPGGVWWPEDAKDDAGKWDLARVKREARYRCENPECTAHAGPTGWDDLERRAAVQNPRGFWRPTKTADVPGWRSYVINGLYGPLKSNDVGELAVDYLSARVSGFFADRQDFWNSRMGLPWLDTVAELDAKKFATREGFPLLKGQPRITYFRGEIPAGWKPDLFIIGFDVQHNRLEWVLRAMDWSGRSCTVDHGNVSDWASLERIQRDYRERLRCRSFVIGDVNYEERRAETLEQVYMRKDLGWFVAEGFEHAAERVRVVSAPVYAGGKLGGLKDEKGQPLHAVTKLILSLYELKVELEKRFTGQIDNWFTYSLPALSVTEDERTELAEYYAQLLDERRVKRKKMRPGKPPFEWRSRQGNNHAFDCEVYILALFWFLQKSRSTAEKKDAARREVREVQRG